jgi:hypothetical protein
MALEGASRVSGGRSTFSLPDTKKNQAEYPQSSSQTEGLGFPIGRAAGLISLATARIHGLTLGPCSGKETGETALFRELMPLLLAGDLVVADRYYGGWFTIALLPERGVDVVTRLHQQRVADFRRGRRLGADDHLVEWPKPQRPDWLDAETYARLPDTLALCEMKFAVRERGFRTPSIVVVTTLRDAEEVSREDLADLYRQRWHAELDLRSLKSTMSLDVLRGKTPNMVRCELWMGLLALQPRATLAAASRRDRRVFAPSPELLRGIATPRDDVADCGGRFHRPDSLDRPAPEPSRFAQGWNSSEPHRTSRAQTPSVLPRPPHQTSRCRATRSLTWLLAVTSTATCGSAIRGRRCFTS